MREKIHLSGVINGQAQCSSELVLAMTTIWEYLHNTFMKAEAKVACATGNVDHSSKEPEKPTQTSQIR